MARLVSISSVTVTPTGVELEVTTERLKLNCWPISACETEASLKIRTLPLGVGTTTSSVGVGEILGSVVGDGPVVAVLPGVGDATSSVGTGEGVIGNVVDVGMRCGSVGALVGDPGAGVAVGSPGAGVAVGSPGAGVAVGSPGAGVAVGSPGAGVAVAAGPDVGGSGTVGSGA
jgi:hypothetical protein